MLVADRKCLFNNSTISFFNAAFPDPPEIGFITNNKFGNIESIGYSNIKLSIFSLAMLFRRIFIIITLNIQTIYNMLSFCDLIFPIF